MDQLIGEMLEGDDCSWFFSRLLRR